jgi:hypothetical protein
LKKQQQINMLCNPKITLINILQSVTLNIAVGGVPLAHSVCLAIFVLSIIFVIFTRHKWLLLVPVLYLYVSFCALQGLYNLEESFYLGPITVEFQYGLELKVAAAIHAAEVIATQYGWELHSFWHSPKLLVDAVVNLNSPLAVYQNILLVGRQEHINLVASLNQASALIEYCEKLALKFGQPLEQFWGSPSFILNVIGGCGSALETETVLAVTAFELHQAERFLGPAMNLLNAAETVAAAQKSTLQELWGSPVLLQKIAACCPPEQDLEIFLSNWVKSDNEFYYWKSKDDLL